MESGLVQVVSIIVSKHKLLTVPDCLQEDYPSFVPANELRLEDRPFFMTAGESKSTVHNSKIVESSFSLHPRSGGIINSAETQTVKRTRCEIDMETALEEIYDLEVIMISA